MSTKYDDDKFFIVSVEEEILNSSIHVIVIHVVDEWTKEDGVSEEIR